MARTDRSDSDVQARRAAIDELARALRVLRADAGQPAFRAMAKASGKVSATTLHDAVSGTRLPTWPTVKAFVEVCGGDSGEWKQQWSRAARACQPAEDAPYPVALPVKATAAAEEPVPQGPPVPASQGGRPRPRSRAAVVLALLVGVVTGVCATWGIGSWTHPAPSLPAPSLPAPGTPGYVARIASATGTAYGTSTHLTVGHAVAAGDTLVVAMMLTNTRSGTVSATDSQGNTYTTAADQTDGADDRTLILTATAVKTLSTSDTITLGYPSTGEQHLTVDELTNVKAIDRHAAATGAAGTDFNSGPTPTSTSDTELAFGVAGVQGGTAAIWSNGFTALPTLLVSHDQLLTGYRTITAAGTYAAAGTCNHQWMAAAVVFSATRRP